MDIQLKPLEDQVIVVTGASSGIGLATARMAAERGASVLLVARNEEVLREEVGRIRSHGGRAAYTTADVSDRAALVAAAAHAQAQFGRIDTWVNNAGVTIYGRIEKVPVDDARRLFETNYFGMVNGSLVALEHLRDSGGAIINIGSVVSDTAMSLQGHYSASKHAVQGFTDALRMELEHDGVPISVSLVKPAAIDTPYLKHARNYMDAEPSFPPPVYSPDVVARTILACAERPTRDIHVGGGARMMAGMGSRLGDRMIEASMFHQQQRPGRDGRMDSLYEPAGDWYGRTRGDYRGHVMKTSMYTAAAMHPVATALGAVLVAATLRSMLD